MRGKGDNRRRREDINYRDSVERKRKLVLARVPFERKSEQRERYSRILRAMLSKSARSSNIRLISPNEKDPFGSSSFGGGGEIRTPATGLPILTI